MDYYGAEVAPLLGDDCIHHGHLGGDALIAAMGAVSVLLSTPMWDEPFGLVAAEAMACDGKRKRSGSGESAAAGAVLSSFQRDIT